MKTKLLKKLRNKFCVMSQDIDIIKTVYSVKGLDRYTEGDPTNAKFYSWDYKDAEKKSEELILRRIKTLRQINCFFGKHKYRIYFGGLARTCIHCDRNEKAKF